MSGSNFKSILLLFVLIGLSAGPVHAQILAVTDNTCTAGQECAGPSGQGCNSTTFSLPTRRDINLCASIKCTTTNCVYCLSVAYICDSNGIVMGCAYNNCSDNCDEGCQLVEDLPAGSYTLYSCKLDCTNEDCSHCTNDCVAKAQIDLFL
jgi:hypothetical protein